MLFFTLGQIENSQGCLFKGFCNEIAGSLRILDLFYFRSLSKF